MTAYLVAGITALAAIVSVWVAMHTAQQERDAMRAQLITSRAAWAAASQTSADQQRQIERQRAKETQDAINSARADAARDAQRAADLGSVNARLRAHITLLAASTRAAGSDTGPATAGEAASGPGMVLADLYRGVDDEAIALAAALDASRRAGLACERIYDGLRGSNDNPR